MSILLTVRIIEVLLKICSGKLQTATFTTSVSYISRNKYFQNYVEFQINEVLLCLVPSNAG
jgi:hypothetical protein